MVAFDFCNQSAIVHLQTKAICSNLDLASLEVGLIVGDVELLENVGNLCTLTL